MSEKIRVAIIYGSIREGRLCDRLVDWVRERMMTQPEFEVDLIDPRMYPQGWNEPASRESSLSRLRIRVAQADAFIVVTPEYNHGYPAALKEVVDAAYREWHGKAAGFVSYGGMSGGIRAVEQLRQVFAELHVATVRDIVSFSNVWDRIGADGEFVATMSDEASFKRMVGQLHWWARALRDARIAAPYQETAQ